MSGKTYPTTSLPLPSEKEEYCMNGPVDSAKGWIAKADSDLATAELVVNAGGPFDTACYHAQQAIEKCLKAVPAASGAGIPRAFCTSILSKLRWASRLELERSTRGGKLGCACRCRTRTSESRAAPHQACVLS